MILSDNELQTLAGTVFPESCRIGPSSVDLTLSNSWLVLDESQDLLDMRKPAAYTEKLASQFLLHPGKFILASTDETVKLPNDISGFVSGRSSVGRLGLQIQNAGYIDAGFHGQITLELQNQSSKPMVLQSGLRCCQLILFKQTSESSKPYSGKYQGQQRATGSLLSEDDEI
jgi:dCTP deaminase